MTKIQAGNALTLAHLLKRKYKKWDMCRCEHCAIGVVDRSSILHFTDLGIRQFGRRVSNLFYGFDILESELFEEITQTQLRKALLEVIDQEGWEEA